MNRSAAVLRNKGVAVTINALVQVDDVWEVDAKSDGEPKSETAWVRFDGNALAALEDGFGSLPDFQEVSGRQPTSTVRRTLAIVFGWDEFHPRLADGRSDPVGSTCPGCRRAGLAMRAGAIAEYTTAIGMAMALANGLDPTKVERMLAQSEKQNAEARESRERELDGMLAEAEAESISTVGSANGSGPVEATTSSGG